MPGAKHLASVFFIFSCLGVDDVINSKTQGCVRVDRLFESLFKSYCKRGLYHLRFVSLKHCVKVENTLI